MARGQWPEPLLGDGVILPSGSSLRIPTLHSELGTPHSLDPLFLYQGWYSNYDVTLAITASYPLVPCTTHFSVLCITMYYSNPKAKVPSTVHRNENSSTINDPRSTIKPTTINHQRTNPNDQRSTIYQRTYLSKIHPDTVRSVSLIAQNCVSGQIFRRGIQRAQIFFR